MRYYTDENISEYLTKMLRLFDRRPEVSFDPHIENFNKGEKDEVWIPAVAKWDPKPIVILGDGRVLKNPALRTIARQSDLSFVVMADGFTNLVWEEMAVKFLKVWPAIVKATKNLRHATIFDVAITSLRVDERFATSKLKQ